MPLSRRQFLKLAASSALLTACTPAARQIVNLIEPQVTTPEEGPFGEAIWYASTCRMCPAGCGIVVRTVNGRAKKIEGNPLHPLNQGKLCARGQAGLQELYHPDRLRNAVRQTGGRGSRQFEPIYWNDGLEILLEQVRETDPERIAFWGGNMADSLYLLTSRWLQVLGAPPPIVFDLQSILDGRNTAVQVANSIYDAQQLPIYDIGQSDAIFSFGANFLETWDSPVAYSHAFGQFRQGQIGGRGFFAQFEPRLSSTAAVADEWIPIRPGTEGFIALAMGRIIVEQGLAGAYGRSFANLYQHVEIGPLAEISDISAESLQRLATIFAASERPVAIPGGQAASHTNGFESNVAIHALNLILRRVGLPGGVFLTPSSPTETLPAASRPDSYASVLDFIEKMGSGEVDLLLIHSSNPVYELPTASGFSDALNQVRFVASFSPFVNDTAVQSDMILPDHTYLENWGYQVVSPGTDRPAVSSQQPVVQPLYDTRSTSSLILALAAELGGEFVEELPWLDEILFLEDSAGAVFGSSLSAYSSKTPGQFWASWLQFGGWWSEKELYYEPITTGFDEKLPLPVAGAVYQGDPAEYPYHLLPTLEEQKVSCRHHTSTNQTEASYHVQGM